MPATSTTSDLIARSDMDNKWHFTEEGDYPVVFGEYLDKHYPQIPCLVEYRKTYGIRFWNVTEECWDDEECDDFFCKKEAVSRWRYLDALLVQQPSFPANLDEAAEGYVQTLCDRADENLRIDTTLQSAFKAGAEWMAEQGQTFGACVDNGCAIASGVKLPFFLWDTYEDGDVLKVQIRKK